MSIIQILQRISVEWGVRCFGTQHVFNRKIRALRFLEEAIELAQACDIPKRKVAKLVKAVYARDVGNARQEVGGCMVTLAVFANAAHLDLEEEFDREVRRVLAKDPKYFAKRNKQKIALGLDA